jgi:YjeF-related protein N-terminus/FDF domain
VTLKAHGNEHQIDKYSVFGKDLLGLKVLDTPTTVTPANKQTSKKERTASAKKEKIPNRQASPKKANAYPHQADTFEVDVAHESFDEDFNFQDALNQFDKKAVFAEIKKLDSTAPEDLLVYHNLRDTNIQPKIPYNINVLDLDRNDDNASPRPATRTRSKSNHVTTECDCQFVSKDGTVISSVTVETMESIKSELSQKGPYLELMIENGARSAAMLVIQALGEKRFTSTEKPHVIILVGNNMTGAYGLATGRHLINHDCLVTVCAAYEGDENTVTLSYLRLLLLSEGYIRIVEEG